MRHAAGTVTVSRHRPEEWPSGQHAVHEHLVLGYCVQGTLRIEQAGAWTLQPGDALLVPAGTQHRWLGSTRGAEIWGLRICATCLAAASASAALDPFDRVRGGAAAVVRIPEARRPFFESLFTELELENAEARPSATRLVALTQLALGEVGRAAQWTTGQGASTLVSETLGWIERHCLGPLGLTEVAAAMHRSPSHLTTTIRRATGKTVQEWITLGRLAEAERLLLHTDERIDIVAERVGYKDPTHFIRTFRKARGSTPAAFRAAHLARLRGLVVATSEGLG